MLEHTTWDSPRGSLLEKIHFLCPSSSSRPPPVPLAMLLPASFLYKGFMWSGGLRVAIKLLVMPWRPDPQGPAALCCMTTKGSASHLAQCWYKGSAKVQHRRTSLSVGKTKRPSRLLSSKRNTWLPGELQVMVPRRSLGSFCLILRWSQGWDCITLEDKWLPHHHNTEKKKKRTKRRNWNRYCNKLNVDFSVYIQYRRITQLYILCK